MPWSICGSANGYSLFHAEYYFLNVATWPFHTLGCNYVIKQQSLTENVACFWMPQWNTSSAVKHLCLLEEAWARAHPATDGAAEIWWQNSPKQAVIMVLEWGRVLYKFVNQQNFNICVWWAGPDTVSLLCGNHFSQNIRSWSLTATAASFIWGLFCHTTFWKSEQVKSVRFSCSWCRESALKDYELE